MPPFNAQLHRMMLRCGYRYQYFSGGRFAVQDSIQVLPPFDLYYSDRVMCFVNSEGGYDFQESDDGFAEFVALFADPLVKPEG